MEADAGGNPTRASQKKRTGHNFAAGGSSPRPGDLRNLPPLSPTDFEVGRGITRNELEDVREWASKTQYRSQLDDFLRVSEYRYDQIHAINEKFGIGTDAANAAFWDLIETTRENAGSEQLKLHPARKVVFQDVESGPGNTLPKFLAGVYTVEDFKGDKGDGIRAALAKRRAEQAAAKQAAARQAAAKRAAAERAEAEAKRARDERHARRTRVKNGALNNKEFGWDVSGEFANGIDE